MIACLVTLPAFISLVVLFFWTATSIIFGGDDDANDEGEYRPWWDRLDMNPEESEALKVVLNLLILAIACATLFVPINKAGSGHYERFNEGVLAASMFMFGNMLFVSFWYQITFGERREEENNDANYYNGYDGYNGYYNAYWTMDERERAAYHQKVASYVTLALALLFYAVSACIHSGAMILPETGHGMSIRQTQAHPQINAQFDLLKEMWTFISLCTFVIFVALFIAACVLSGGEGAERMREEGRIINLILVLLCMVIVTTAILIWGSNVFTIEKASDSLGMGMIYGGTKYFAALLFMVCVLFANPTFDERQREEGIWVAPATSFASLFLSLAYLVFSMRTRKYQVSVIDASENVMVLRPQTGMVHSATGDFVYVEETGTQMT